MTESKIVATDRLRQEGRWEVASWYRDRQRQRLRREGLTRREAREKAWEGMLEKFPPLTPAERDWQEANHWLLAAEFPPDPKKCPALDKAGEPLMADLWWALCTLRAAAVRWKQQDAHGCRGIWLAMWRQAPNAQAQERTTLAAADPRRFGDQVTAKFQAADEDRPVGLPAVHRPLIAARGCLHGEYTGVVKPVTTAGWPLTRESSPKCLWPRQIGHRRPAAGIAVAPQGARTLIEPRWPQWPGFVEGIRGAHKRGTESCGRYGIAPLLGVGLGAWLVR